MLTKTRAMPAAEPSASLDCNGFAAVCLPVYPSESDIPYGIGADDWDVSHSNTNAALLGSSPAQERAGAVFKLPYETAKSQMIIDQSAESARLSTWNWYR